MRQTIFDPWTAFRFHFRIFVLLLLLPVLATACSIAEPVKTAETPEQKGFALYATFVVMQEKAADVVEDPDTPGVVVEAIQKADRIAQPASKLLQAAAYQLQLARARLREVNDQTTLDEFQAALTTFNERLAEDGPKLEALIAAVREEL